MSVAWEDVPLPGLPATGRQVEVPVLVVEPPPVEDVCQVSLFDEERV